MPTPADPWTWTEFREVAKEAGRHRQMEERLLPSPIDYASVAGLRVEASEKLTRHQPRTFGQASRIAGVTPSDLAALLIHVARAEAMTP